MRTHVHIVTLMDYLPALLQLVMMASSVILYPMRANCARSEIAGDGNRTHAKSLGSSRSTIELHPLQKARVTITDGREERTEF